MFIVNGVSGSSLHCINFGAATEPACGVGNFFGMLPEEMQKSCLYGVELDSISGRIAKQLYPEANITVAGFETTNRRDFYDLAIGNVPFGQYQVNDKAYNKLGFSIHNYFFAKALDQVRPGGLVAFVTSRYTMDAKDPTVRRYLSQRAELLGAIRLPTTPSRPTLGRMWCRTFFSFSGGSSPSWPMSPGFNWAFRMVFPSAATLWSIPRWCWES